MNKLTLMALALLISMSLAACNASDYSQRETKKVEKTGIEGDAATAESKEPVESEESPESIEANVAPFEIVTDDDFTITVDKVIADESLLKIYVTYDNETGVPISPCESLSKIVDLETRKQIEYDIEINDTLFEDIESGVVQESVLVFKRPEGNSFNLVMNVNYEEYRVNNILIQE